MSEQTRWTCVFKAVARVASHGDHVAVRRTHLVSSVDQGRCWTLCGRLLHPGNARMSGQLSLDEVTCATCRDANLEERRRLAPGWWGRR